MKLGRQEENIIGRPRRRKGATALLLALLLLSILPLLPHLLAKRYPQSAGGGRADALFVLTGGEKRIAEGYRAFREGRGAVLYILGVGRDSTLDRILPREERDPARDAGRVFAEGWSENTLENAFYANSVVRHRRWGSVVLVTSDYHMARAALTFRTILPASVALSVLPVRTEWKGIGGFVRTARLFYVEGWKYWGYRIILRFE